MRLIMEDKVIHPKIFKDFYTAWWWLVDHPYYEDLEHIEFCGIIRVEPSEESVFTRTLDIHVTRVDPVTGTVEDDPKRNTHKVIWLESGAWVKDEVFGWMASHDCDLDCGGDTYEEAILALAELVLLKYGNYTG